MKQWQTFDIESARMESAGAFLAGGVIVLRNLPQNSEAYLKILV